MNQQMNQRYAGVIDAERLPARHNGVVFVFGFTNFAEVGVT